MTDKEQITMIMWTLAEFNKRFGAMKANLDRVLEGQKGAGESADTHTPKKYVMGPTY